MSICVYNTLSHTKEKFEPVTAGKVGIYLCGPTVYKPSHIGHAVGPIIFDAVKRYLTFRGFQVTWVVNITDVEDKIIAEAAEQGCTAFELAERITGEYVDAMDRLNITGIDKMPKASEHIGDIIRFVERLIDRGAAYVAGGDVYFDVTSDDDYGKLSNRSIDDQRGERDLQSGAKHHPGDFALWKEAKPEEPEAVKFDSPWGKGRPGWHIECSVMSTQMLGETFDIHGGGMDLIFPHHENEIAQSEAYTGREPFVRFWLHNGWLYLGEEKMSKSLGNIIPISDALQKYGGDGCRLFVLNSHYRSPLTYSEEGLEAGKRGAERLRLAANLPGEGKGAPLDAQPLRQRFIEAMEDDLNTAQATASLFDLAREINRSRDEGRPVQDAQATLRELAGLLGLTLTEEEAAMAVRPFIDLLVEVRDGLREAKLYDLSDRVRVRLAELGIALEDTAGSTRWRRRD